MNKAIIFSRVSTTSQEYTEQTNRLKISALRDGFSAENLVYIEEKESGIKLSEEERLGLTELKNTIVNDSISAVYIFEVSRLARTKKVLFSIEDFLVKNKVQLKIDTPSVSLLNNDGSVNDAAEMIFTLYAQMAESEMRIKKERFRNGKNRAKKEGRFMGGTVTFGFSVDADNRLIVNDAEAAVVRDIYRMYIDDTPRQIIAQYATSNGVGKRVGVFYRTRLN